MKKRFALPVVLLALLIPTAGLAFAHHARSIAQLVGVSKNAKLGNILVNDMAVTSLSNKKYPAGFTLYHLLKENTGKFVCTGGCLTFWPPLLLPAGMVLPTGGKGVTDKLGVINRKGVGKQITYDGWPLYFFQPDKKPGDTNGDGVKAFNSVWHVVQPTPMVTFTIKIAPDSTWGVIKLSYTYNGKGYKASCSANTCKVKVHAGVKVTLSEKPTTPSSWPFSAWKVVSVNGGGTSTSAKTSISVTSNDEYKVTATYVLK